MYTQLSLFDDFVPLSPSPGFLIPAPQHDPYWDEIEETSDTLTCAFLPSVECKALDFGVDELFAPQQNTLVGEQLPDSGSACKSVGEQVTSDTLKFAPQHDGKLYTQLSEEKATYYSGSAYKSVGEQVTSDTLKFAPQHNGKLYTQLSEEKTTHWLEKYWVERGTNKYWYYRYMWMEGRKLHRVYIGSVTSNKAKSKKQTVEEAITDGQSPQEIIALIRSFRS